MAQVEIGLARIGDLAARVGACRRADRGRRDPPVALANLRAEELRS